MSNSRQHTRHPRLSLSRTRPARLRRGLPLLGALGALSVAVFGCEGPGRSGEPSGAATASGGEATGDGTLHAQPYQSSAITMVGSAGGRPNAWTFERFTADLKIEHDAPTRLDVVIDTASAATSEPSLRARLAGADLLNVATHPKATFHATELREVSRAKEGFSYRAAGTLTVAGKSHQATVPFVMSRAADGTTTLRVSAPVSKSAWAAAFAEPSNALFDQELQLRARLVFPAATR